MTLFLLAYAAGVLTIASPCIVPVLPFVLARADLPFRRGGLPMLLGMALTFAAVASLAAVAGGWAVELNRHGRNAALAMMTLFGLTMLFPTLAARAMAPVVAIGARLSHWTEQRRKGKEATAGSSMLLGVATGFVWAPCAGPVMGVILTGAALRGPNVETSLLLLTYGLGAATSLAAGILFGRHLLSIVRQSSRWGGGVHRVLGAAVVAGTALIWVGADTGLLTRLSSASTEVLERDLIATLSGASASGMARAGDSNVAAADLPSPLNSLFGRRTWLNGQLRGEDVRGKVVLVSFWTYSCINCLRALPYIRSWAETYRDRGLVVIGVHTPEFAFEKDIGNVRGAATALGVSYPVVIDNDFAIWRAFNNNAWPAVYFIDANGRVRNQVLGEGRYAQSEQLIQRLLSEASGVSVKADAVTVSGQGAQAPADGGNLRSPETYIGYSQARQFVSPGGVKRDAPKIYQPASVLPLNSWSLAGDWTVGGEFASLNDASGSISYRFHARDLHLVMGASAQGRPIRFRITIDGSPPGADHEVDVDADGWGTVGEERLYQLVRQSGSVAQRSFEIRFFDAGVRAYAFTFG